jgi:hypothetical protein
MRHIFPLSPRAGTDEPCDVRRPSDPQDSHVVPSGGSLPVVPEARSVATRLDLECCRAGDVRRGELERYVAEVYARAYGARLTHFQPLLVGLREPGGALQGVIGARPAREPGPLFLEAYLDQPVEALLSVRLGEPVARGDLVEVGNLASHRPGAGRLLLGTLAHLLAGLGTPVAVFTATRPLRATFHRLGVQPTELALADGTRLGGALEDWGRYYQTDPRVCAVPVRLVRDATRSVGAHEGLRALGLEAPRLGRCLAREGGP